MSDYKFVTKEDIDALSFPPTTYKGWGIALVLIAHLLLKERDAYREFLKTLPLPIEVADMEVQRILGEKK